MRTVIEPLSPLRRQMNRDLREHGREQRAEIVQADRDQRRENSAADLAALGDVRDLSRRDYAKAKANAIKLLRLSR